MLKIYIAIVNPVTSELTFGTVWSNYEHFVDSNEKKKKTSSHSIFILLLPTFEKQSNQQTAYLLQSPINWLTIHQTV